MTSLLRLAAAACLLPVLALAADRPNLKLGLWEINYQGTGATMAPPAGAPTLSPEVLSRMPPEARARIEAAAAGRSAPGGHTIKQCLTAKSLDHAFRNDDARAKKCTNKIVTQSSTGAEVTFECPSIAAGGGAMTTGVMKWTALSPESTKGSLTMTFDFGRGPMSHTTEFNGKWIATDCGDVKPHEEDTK